MKYKIYKILNQLNEIIYIGKTTTSLEKRFYGNYKNIPNKKECSIELVENTNDSSRERYWIEFYREAGCQLLNIYKGDGFHKKEYNKQHKKDNPECYINKRKKHYENNKEYYKVFYKKRYEKKKALKQTSYLI